MVMNICPIFHPLLYDLITFCLVFPHIFETKKQKHEKVNRQEDDHTECTRIYQGENRKPSEEEKYK